MKSVIEFSGVVGDTFRVASTNIAQVLDPANYIVGGLHAISAIITSEDNAIRFAFGDSVPTQGAGALGHILPKDWTLKLTDISDIRTFSFISHTNGAHAALQVTFGFPR